MYMKKIIMEYDPPKTITFDQVDQEKAIFAFYDSRLVGMIIKEGMGWGVKIGSNTSATRNYATLQECINVAEKSGYEFFISA